MLFAGRFRSQQLLCPPEFPLLPKRLKVPLPFPFSKPCNRLVGSEWLSWCRPGPWKSCVSEAEESNFVHTKPPLATLWHEMTLSRGNLPNNTRPSIRVLRNNHACIVPFAPPAPPGLTGRVGEGLSWEGLFLCLIGLPPWDNFGLGADGGS